MNTEKKEKKKPSHLFFVQADNYDIIVRELAFDLKARPTDRTKTPEELAREERDRLELLEKQRLMRMTDQQHADTAPGGDDLDEGYYEAVEQYENLIQDVEISYIFSLSKSKATRTWW